MEKEDRSDANEVCSGYQIDWRIVKEDYLSSKYSVEELAEKHGCYPETIEKYIRRGYWPCCRPVHKVEAASSSAELSADKPEGLTKEYRILLDGVKKRLIGALQSSDIKESMDELKAAKVAAEVLNTVIKGEKEAWGLQEGELRKVPDEETIRIEELTRTMESLTVPSGADETMG